MKFWPQPAWTSACKFWTPVITSGPFVHPVPRKQSGLKTSQSHHALRLRRGGSEQEQGLVDYFHFAAVAARHRAVCRHRSKSPRHSFGPGPDGDNPHERVYIVDEQRPSRAKHTDPCADRNRIEHLQSNGIAQPDRRRRNCPRCGHNADGTGPGYLSVCRIRHPARRVTPGLRAPCTSESRHRAQNLTRRPLPPPGCSDGWSSWHSPPERPLPF